MLILNGENVDTPYIASNFEISYFEYVGFEFREAKIEDHTWFTKLMTYDVLNLIDHIQLFHYFWTTQKDLLSIFLHCLKTLERPFCVNRKLIELFTPMKDIQEIIDLLRRWLEESDTYRYLISKKDIHDALHAITGPPESHHLRHSRVQPIEK